MSLASLLLPVWAKPVLIAVAVASALGALAWYRASLIEKGRDEIRAEWSAATQAAKDKQAVDNITATAQLITKTAEQKTIYKTRIEEILVYVPTPNTTCPADTEFERLYNTPGAAGSAKP